MNERLYRSVDDRMVAGVCGGLAVRLAIDPSLVRVGWAVLALVTGIFPLLIVYVVMAAVVPEDPAGFAGAWPSPTPPGTPGAPGAAAAPADAPADPAGAAATAPASATVAGAPVAGASGPPPPTTPWPQGAPPPGWRRRERRERDPMLAIIGGLVLVAFGFYFLVRDRIAVDWGVVGAATLVAVGALVIVAALRPRH
jgi:phage shock protein C